MLDKSSGRTRGIAEGAVHVDLQAQLGTECRKANLVIRDAWCLAQAVADQILAVDDVEGRLVIFPNAGERIQIMFGGNAIPPPPAFAHVDAQDRSEGRGRQRAAQIQKFLEVRPRTGLPQLPVTAGWHRGVLSDSLGRLVDHAQSGSSSMPISCNTRSRARVSCIRRPSVVPPMAAAIAPHSSP